MNSSIKLPVFDITITTTPEGGNITSSLVEPCDCYTGSCDGCFKNTYMRGILHTVLQHACAGVDVVDPAYIRGIEQSVAWYEDDSI